MNERVRLLINDMDSREILDKINALEYKKIASLEDKINQTQISLERNNVLTEKNVEAMEKLSITMENVTTTMNDISCHIRQQGEIQRQLSDNVGSLSEKINNVDKKVDSVKSEMIDKINQSEEKNKIDIRQIIKDILIKFILPGGVIGTLIVFLMQNYK